MDVLQFYGKYEDCRAHSPGVLSLVATQYFVLLSCSATKSHLLSSLSAKEVLKMNVIVQITYKMVHIQLFWS
jgi:hypothetical protein